MRFVVAGATGNVGSAAVRRLASQGHEVQALTRDAASAKAADLKTLNGVQVVQADLLDSASYAAVWAGAAGALLACSNSKSQAETEMNFVDSAVAHGCPYLVKLGTVQSYTAKDSPVEYARHHAEVEAHLEVAAGGMKWTVLHPNWFMSNHAADIFGTLPLGIIAYPVQPDAKAAMVDPRDVGEVAAALLVASDPAQYHAAHMGVSGPVPVTLSELAAMYTAALGRPITAAPCTEAAWVAGAVKAGFPDWLADAVAYNFTKWTSGEMLFPTHPAVAALAPPQRTMADWVKEWAPRSPPASS